jgi:hypothetical protein
VRARGVQALTMLLEGHEVDVAVVARPPPDVKVGSDAAAQPDRALESSEHTEPPQDFALGHPGIVGPPLPLTQGDQPGVGWREPTGAEVERSQVLFEVDV